MALAVVSPSDWFEERQVAELSGSLGESAEVARQRRTSFEAYRKLPTELNPLYRQYSYFGGVDLRGTSPLRSGSPVRLPDPGPGTVLILHDATGTRVKAPPDLLKAGLELSTLEEIVRGPQAEAFLGAGAPRAEKFAALNSALVNRGVHLRVPDGLELPVRIKDVSVLSEETEALFIRRVLHAGKATRVCYSEEVYSTSEKAPQRPYSSVVHATTGPDAQLVYLTVHAPDASAVSFYNREAATGPGSRLAWIWSGFGGFRTNYRNETHLAAPGSEVDDFQTLFGDGRSSFNNFVEVTHDCDDTRGQSVTRSVLKDEARGTAKGMMRILANTRKVVSYLSEHAMLLSRAARSEAAPDLEILSSNDVKATHSASVAPIDAEKVFYLESRGIPQELAVRMVAEGFLSYVLDRAPVDGLRDVLYPLLEARWNRRSVLWSPTGELPSLPPLTISGWSSMGDWRYDTKLRDTAGRG